MSCVILTIPLVLLLLVFYQDCEQLAEVIFAKAGEGINPYALDYPVCTAQIAADESSSTTTTTTTAAAHHRQLISSQVHQLYYEKRRNRHNHKQNSPPFVPVQDHYQPCSEYHAIQYLNQRSVRKALHVNETWSSKKWNTCNLHLKYSAHDIATDVVPLYKELLSKALSHEHALNIMIYSGDDDSVCATAGTQTWLWGLGVPALSTNWTWTPWQVDHQTAGYLTKFNVGTGGAKFTFVTVHGAGHEVPAYRPKEALAMFQSYLNGTW
jgi:carboxypeptidase C (cathepsin A)